VTEEDFVQEVVWDLLSRQSLVATRSQVEEELVAVPQLHKEACGRLFRSRAGHACAQGDDPHLIRPDLLGARVVDIPLCDRLDR
jgi:hypothetical protein